MNSRTSNRSGTHTTQKQIGIRVPSAMGARLAALARAESNSVSAIARRILTVGLAREEAQQEQR